MGGVEGYGELEGVYLKVFDKGRERGGDGWEVMVLELVVVGGLVWDEGGGGEEEVGRGGIEWLV